jgi:hypothetical protein
MTVKLKIIKIIQVANVTHQLHTWVIYRGTKVRTLFQKITTTISMIEMISRVTMTMMSESLSLIVN